MQAVRSTVFTSRRQVHPTSRVCCIISSQFISLDKPLDIIAKIHARNMKAGVAISPDTSSTKITDEIGNAADLLLVMTVHPGIGLPVFFVVNLCFTPY